MEKNEILRRLLTATEEFAGICRQLDTDLFFDQPPEKWSIAQHVQHLVISSRTTRLAFTLPPFLLKMITGTPNRQSRSYEELVQRYQSKLLNGGKAGGRFVPAVIKPAFGQSKLIGHFATAMDRLHTTIAAKWQDSQLDRYLAPHPLLGRITLRELACFTIYHTYHHLDIIRRMEGSKVK